MSENGFTKLAMDNREAMTPEAAAFYKGRFSAVRTLSPKSTALIWHCVQIVDPIVVVLGF
jgi:hypothetical protein